MSIPKIGYAHGKCPRCGKTLRRRRPAFIVYCDCWKYCPLCGREMTPYTPDLNLQFYDPDKGLSVVMYCSSCNHYSKQLPVEVHVR